MFDILTVSKRYFEIKFTVSMEETVNGEVVEVEKEYKLEIKPPKLKALKKIMSLSKTRQEEAMDDLSEAIRMIFNSNKTNYAVPIKVIDELNYDEMNEILTAYFEWLNKEKNTKN